MLSALYAIPRPSVRPSVTRVYHTKTVDGRITKFSPYGSPIPLVLWGKFHPEILMGPPSGASNKRGGENQPFLSFKRQYLENDSRYGQSYY